MRMNITVKNLRVEQPTEPWQVKVDRSSPLWGNPFKMNNQSELERFRVCAAYHDHLRDIMYENLYHAEIQHLIELHDTYGKLELFCWCAPKLCHADILRAHIIRYPFWKKDDTSNRDEQQYLIAMGFLNTFVYNFNSETGEVL